MGADIHFTIEFQDDNQTWHGLYASSLFWTAWWQSRFMKGMDKYRDDPHGLSGVRQRDYDLFAFLSAVRGGNALAKYGLGDEDGWAKRTKHKPEAGHGPYGWPKDASPLAREGMEDPDLHSHGWTTLADLRALGARVEDLLPTLAPEGEAYDNAVAAQRFWRNVEDALSHLLGTPGTPGIVTQPIHQVPDDNAYDDPAFDVHAGYSAHALLAATSYLRDRPTLADHDPNRIRVLIAYDN
jgi:hypothetical protein